MGSLIAIWRIVVRRALSNWKMLGVLGVGVLVAATLLASAPVYARTMSDLGLTYPSGKSSPGPRHHASLSATSPSANGQLPGRRYRPSASTTVSAGSAKTSPLRPSRRPRHHGPRREPVQGGPGGFLQISCRLRSTRARHRWAPPRARRRPASRIEVVLHPEAAATAGLVHRRPLPAPRTPRRL
jgi:hypothetical protein